ncbi:hypothetical protein Pelo_7155 [Pelomyxa schiedti]|nr:hypothetical protein Pelo_7155 [Pelomyxa schiedti]
MRSQPVQHLGSHPVLVLLPEPQELPQFGSIRNSQSLVAVTSSSLGAALAITTALFHHLFQYREINPDVAISTTKLCTSHLKAGSALHHSNSSSAAYNAGSRQTLSRLLQVHVFLVMKVGNHCRQNSLHSSYLPKLRFLKEKLQPAVIPTAAGVLLSQCSQTMKGDSWRFPPCSLQCLRQLCVVLMSSTTAVLSLARGGISSYLGVCHATVSPDHDSGIQWTHSTASRVIEFPEVVRLLAGTLTHNQSIQMNLSDGTIVPTDDDTRRGSSSSVGVLTPQVIQTRFRVVSTADGPIDSTANLSSSTTSYAPACDVSANGHNFTMCDRPDEVEFTLQHGGKYHLIVEAAVWPNMESWVPLPGCPFLVTATQGLCVLPFVLFSV